MLALRKLRSTQWTGLRVLAAVLIAAGLFGTASGLTELIEKFGEGGTRASNPVVDNDQRRHAAMRENQVKDYPSNLAALSAFSAFVALVTLHFVGLAWRMFAKVPLSSIMGGLFLSASGICGAVPPDILHSPARVVVTGRPPHRLGGVEAAGADAR